MKIVAIVGSIRKESFNKKLAAFIQSQYEKQVDIEILPIEKFPMYNQDKEQNPMSIVRDTKQKISESDGILIVTPEYNHSVPGVLKNAIDWFSRVDKVMVNKPVMIAGGSTGILGTARAQMHLRQILNSPGVSALTLPGNEVFIAGIHQKIDETGKVIDESTIQILDKAINNFVDWIEKNKST